ncbi:MAG: hypothetical protein GY765_02165 [bacterium]|nr:hypothetical protein [bacterium]
MIHVDKGVRPEEIRQSGSHVLIVEGYGNDSLAPWLSANFSTARYKSNNWDHFEIFPKA